MTTTRNILLITLFSLGSLLKSYATTYYVNAAASGTQNGLSWENAFTSLQTALSSVVYGDEIWVAAGQYKPTTSTTRTTAFVLRDGVNMYGGFAGNETSIAERNIAGNPTVLNGDIGQAGETSDNSYNVIRGSNITSTIELDGFRIMNGNCNGSSQTGGGLRYLTSLSGHLFIKNCYFYSNRASSYGGALYISSSNVTIEKCEFISNQSSGNGGAIYTFNNNDGYSNLVIRDSKFVGNVAYSGAVHDNSAPYQSILIDRCIFTNNSSDNGILHIDEFNNAKILNSYLIGNKVNTFSPTFISIGQLNGSSTAKTFEMVNCTIAHNYNVYVNTIQSEMIKLHKAHHKVRNCIIYGNTPYAGRQMKLGNNVADCLIENGYTNGVNIMNQDPQFVNPNLSATSNFNAGSYDYSLSETSPCINAGNNSFVYSSYNLDLNKQARLQGCVVDLGCYETDKAHTFTATDQITACETYTWIDDITYTENNNTATFTLQSALGCDSVVTLNLTIGHPATATDVRTICEGSSLQWIDGNTYTAENNSATHTLTTPAGCDSVVTLNLTVLPNATGTDVRTACGSFTWINGQTYTQSNTTATFALTSSNGCDSIVHLSLTIHPLPTPTISQSGITLSTQLFSSYQWKRNGNPVPGATSQTYTPTQSGNYTVTVTNSNGCTGTSSVQNVTVSNVGIKENEKQVVTLFPNPAKNYVTISGAPLDAVVAVMDLTGKRLFETRIVAAETVINTEKLTNGVYFITIDGRVTKLQIAR
ncbi:T9SS type A sorting domain-containing protein [Crocinitomicaceae bacterium CZZ-1]|uniref:T9SS type A sorting domain-containing protein n=1 Tax=Taishania pollutisoli TaxID=2766479 RepID=A0A8J6TXL4_9FLAO|nr:T9SS type A sorting domain-containing protein [Taishania pollutisoli]MBC9812686.1 T9SS type A sorting domain-containing protein [Taishania pollutisoli]